jgi:hypothetical protein
MNEPEGRFQVSTVASNPEPAHRRHVSVWSATLWAGCFRGGGLGLAALGWVAVLSITSACADLSSSDTRGIQLTSNGDGQSDTCRDDTTTRLIQFEQQQPKALIDLAVDMILDEGMLFDDDPDRIVEEIEPCAAAADANECTFCRRGRDSKTGATIEVLGMSGDYLGTNGIDVFAGPRCELLLVRATLRPTSNSGEATAEDATDDPAVERAKAADRAHVQRDEILARAQQQLEEHIQASATTLELDSSVCERVRNGAYVPEDMRDGDGAEPWSPSWSSGADDERTGLSECMQVPTGPPRFAGWGTDSTEEKCPSFPAFRRLRIPSAMRNGFSSDLMEGDHARRLCYRLGSGGVYGYKDYNPKVSFGDKGHHPSALDPRLLLAAARIAERFDATLLITSAVDGNRQGGWSLHKPGWAIDFQVLAGANSLTTKKLFDQHKCEVGRIVLGVWGKSGTTPHGPEGASYQLIREKRSDYVLHLGMIPRARQLCDAHRTGPFIEGKGAGFSCSI